MKKQKHTPGLWSVDGYNLTVVIAEYPDKPRHFQHICDCNYGQESNVAHCEVNKANARFIAVAPNMLEQLKQSIIAIKEALKTIPINNHAYDYLHGVIAAHEILITKVEK